MKALIAWILMSLQWLGAADEPGRAAVRHLEKIRDGSINLEPGGDTAITRQTGDTKRAEIAQRIKRMALDMGGAPLAAGSSKVDGDLAAVMVGQSPGFDLDAFRVTAVALVRVGGVWTAAPLPGSFQNSGIPFDPAIRERARFLEDWMIEQQGPELAGLRDTATARLRERIDRSLPSGERLSMDSGQCAERFLKACLEKDFPVIAGLLGGASPVLPDAWNQLLKTAGVAVESADKAPRPWRLMMAPEVLRIPVQHEESGNRGRITIACLDPAGVPPKFSRPEVEQIILELVKSPDGPWIVNLPHEFLTSDGGGEGAPSAEPLDESLAEAIRGALVEQIPPKPETSPARARDALLSAFRSGNPSLWAAMVSTPADGEGTCASLAAAAAVWRSFSHPPTVHHALPLGDHGDADRHGFVFQLFSILNPDQVDLRELHFVRTVDGWHWEPSPADDSLTEFNAWKSRHEKEWRDGWRRILLDECRALEEIAVAEAPSEDDARAVVENWTRALREGDIRAAIRLTTRLNLPDSGVTLLRNLGYEINAIRSEQTAPLVGGVLRSDPWTLVGMKPSHGKRTGFPCFPVVHTEDGPRILLETDLLASETRSRQYLNGISLKRLAKSNPGIAGTLEKLFSTLCAGSTDKAPASK